VLAVTVLDEDLRTGQEAAEAELCARVQVAIAETGVRGRTQVQVLTGPVAQVLTDLSDEADVLVLGRHHREAGRAG
jgi:hypothetical protein